MCHIIEYTTLSRFGLKRVSKKNPKKTKKGTDERREALFNEIWLQLINEVRIFLLYSSNSRRRQLWVPLTHYKRMGIKNPGKSNYKINQLFFLEMHDNSQIIKKCKGFNNVHFEGILHLKYICIKPIKTWSVSLTVPSALW